MFYIKTFNNQNCLLNNDCYKYTHILHFYVYFFSNSFRPFSNYICEWELVVTNLLTKMVLTLVLQELWPTLSNYFCTSSLQINPIYSCQLPHQFSHRPFAVPPYQRTCCFLFFAGRLQVQPRCFLSLILDGGSNRYMNDSSSVDHFSTFFRVFFLSVSDRSWSPNKKGLDSFLW